MPSGAGPGGVIRFSMVGRSRADGSASGAGGPDRIVVKARIAAAIGRMKSHAQALPLRRVCERALIGFERRLLIWGSAVRTTARRLDHQIP